MKNILVLGGTGFVGAHVCEKLVRQGFNVTVPTRRRSNAQHIQHLPSLTVMEMSVHDAAALSRAVAGHDAVVNLVAILHGAAAAFEQVHVALPKSLARACAAHAVRRVVHISALGADDVRPDDAPSEYLRSKGRGEAALLHPADSSYSLDVTVLRPSVIFGAEDKFMNLFAKLQAVLPIMPLAGAQARFQPVWVEDVADAVAHCLVRPVAVHAAQALPLPRIVEAFGPEVFTLKELVRLSARLAGTNEGQGRPVWALPGALGRLQAWLMECAPGEPLMSRDNLNSMSIDNVASGKLAGLAALGITASALEPIAAVYLRSRQATAGLLGVRIRAR
ncbi:MAG: NAD-dependent dehydratase [Burkholderiales bacterium PBB3]|nr:MAG: NAD-dependent dehydratase [Burkholderiales bacterium PBB3]